MTDTFGLSVGQQEFILDVEAFRRRVLQDALTEATAGYWMRRAADCGVVRHIGYVWPSTVRLHKAWCPSHCTRCPALHHEGAPKTDYPGKVSAEDTATRDAELAGTARACRKRAALSSLQTFTEADQGLEEVA